MTGTLGATANLWFNNPITINTGDTVQAGYAIQMSAATHPAATVKVPNATMQTDVTCGDGSSYTLYIPLYPTTNLIPICGPVWSWADLYDPGQRQHLVSLRRPDQLSDLSGLCGCHTCSSREPWHDGQCWLR